jgi:membrane protein YdbS with pleckstrin-like domain
MNETVKAVISAAVVFVCAIAGALGFDLSTDTVWQVISAVVFIAAVAWGVWKNHNFTQAAWAGQALVDELKQAAKEGKNSDGE